MNIIIKKWIQPYLLIEYLKDFYNVVDLTFDGASKNKFKQQMFAEVDSGNIGLYMKNVNKFYVLKDKSSDTLLVDIIKDKLDLTDADLAEEADKDKALGLVDLGKSEASFFIR